MATLTLTGSVDSNGSITATISGLGNQFTTQYYQAAGISYYETAYGSSQLSGAPIQETYPSSSGTTSVTFYLTGMGYGTITLYAYARANDSLYYPAGSASVTINSPRPSSFSWTYAGINNNSVVNGTQKISGYGFYVHHTEWNALLDNINGVRNYKGLSNYSFTNVSTDTPFYSSCFNEVIAALSAMISFSSPTSKSTGSDIYASDLNQIVTILNSIT